MIKSLIKSRGLVAALVIALSAALLPLAAARADAPAFSAQTANPMPGDTYTYVVDYTNDTGEALLAFDVDVTVNTAGWTLISATQGTSPGTLTPLVSGNTLKFRGGALAIAATDSMSFTVRVNDPVLDGTNLTFGEILTSALTESFNTVETYGSGVSMQIHLAALVVGLTADDATLDAGLTTRYRLSVENVGSRDASSLVYTANLSSRLSYVPGSAQWNGAPFGDPTIVGSQLTWNAASLAAFSGPQELSFSVLVSDATLDTETLQNVTAGVIGNQGVIPVAILADMSAYVAADTDPTDAVGRDLTIRPLAIDVTGGGTGTDDGTLLETGVPAFAALAFSLMTAGAAAGYALRRRN
ncbi:hypothetical protein ACFL1U_01080 [Patescibacteria group bacterium]